MYGLLIVRKYIYIGKRWGTTESEEISNHKSLATGQVFETCVLDWKKACDRTGWGATRCEIWFVRILQRDGRCDGIFGGGKTVHSVRRANCLCLGYRLDCFTFLIDTKVNNNVFAEYIACKFAFIVATR